MATIKWEDQECELVEDWRVGELIEAENALGLDMNTAKGASQIALVVYISIRRTDPQTPSGVLADMVMRMELSALADDDEATAPLEEGDAPSAAAGPGGEPTTGPRRLASTA